MREPTSGSGDPLHGSDNAYLFADEETLLFDTFSPASANKIHSYLDEILDDRELDYIAISHPEPNHAGNVHRLLDAYPDATLVVPARGNEHHLYGIDDVPHVRYVNPRDSLTLGTFDLEFVPPYFPDHGMHIWMYERTMSALFCVDWMGYRHGTDCLRFAEDFSETKLKEGMEAFVSFALPWVQHVSMDRVSAAIEHLLDGYSPEIIAPAHGQIIRERPREYIRLMEEVMARISEREIDPAEWPTSDADGLTEDPE
ncbi:MBL fold metallo-hydrolase [Halobellus sp. GM3]|uniref:MBL fold metallo-hydrolase n=1 Tax=Halobellus sp. GM3 TaxID=3458410 RepID=UPI00403D7C8E